MDPLTNTLAAFTLGRTGLRSLAPHGTAVLIAAVNFPDLDWISTLVDATNVLAFVGGPLHSLVLAPVWAMLVAGLAWLLSGRKAPVQRAYALALTGLLLRSFLDLLPVFGVQSFYPFDTSWHAWGVLPFADPWLLLLLITYTFWPLLSHYVDMEIGVRKTAGQGVAFLTLLLAAAYCGYRAGNIVEAQSIVRNHEYGNEPSVREQCYPDLFSLARVHCALETESQMVEVDYFPGEDFDAIEAAVQRKQPKPMWQVAEVQSHTYARIASRLRMPYWAVYPATYPETGSELVLRDLVLAPDPYPLFELRIKLNENEALQSERFQVSLWGNPVLSSER